MKLETLRSNRNPNVPTLFNVTRKSTSNPLCPSVPNHFNAAVAKEYYETLKQSEASVTM